MPSRVGNRRVLRDPQTFQIPGSWVLSFSDEFPGAAIDAAKWNTPSYSPGNTELEWYQGANVTVANGRCTLTAKSETVVHGATYNYTSGIINTNGIFSQTYGYYEASMWLPAGKGLWPAFWMLPADGSWPPELDVMEVLGDAPYVIYMTEHYGTSGSPQQSSTTYGGGPDFSVGFHTFGMHWTPSFIRWYVDGFLRYEVTTNIPSVPMYLICNLAVGGTFPGSPDGSTVFPATCQIEYVRAYSTPDTVVAGVSGSPIGLLLSLTYP